MKTEDYDKLKQLCDANGYELLTESPKENDKFYVVKKKDIWDGVEFALYSNNEKTVIRKIDRIEGFWIWFSNGYKFSKAMMNPSTESAYIEQLKKIAFEKFGEIKEGDRFDFTNVGYEGQKLYFDKDGGYIDWEYVKYTDKLVHYGFCIYQQGKWAEKLPERVKVDYIYKIDGRLYYHFHKDKSEDYIGPPVVGTDVTEIEKIKEIGAFLSKQLEEYLNKQL